MKSALRKLCDLLPFNQPLSEQKAAEVRGLLDTFAGLSSYEMIIELTTQVVPAITKHPNLHMRFKLLEDARLEAEKALPVLEQHIDYASLPLPIAAKTSALAADNLMKALAGIYFDLAKEIADGNQHKAMCRMFQRATQHAMALLARRQQLANRSYAKPSSSSWIRLHELYLLARRFRAGLHELDISPIEHQYLSALLFSYLEPSKLPRCDLAAAIFCTQQLATHATITDVTPEISSKRTNGSLFLIRPEDGNPGTALRRIPQGVHLFDGLIIDCSGVVLELEKLSDISPDSLDETGLDPPPRPGHLTSGHRITLTAFGETQLWQIGRRLEASDGLEFFALVPL